LRSICLGLAEEIGFCALSRYDDVVAAHLDTDTFSSSHGVTMDRDGAGGPFLIVKDPPEHMLHRKIAARMFTPRRIASSSRSSGTPRQACSTGCGIGTASTWSRSSRSGCRWT
jgi:hypothetical protein